MSSQIFLDLYTHINKLTKGDKRKSEVTVEKLNSRLGILPKNQVGEARILLSLFYIHSRFGSDINGALAECISKGVIEEGSAECLRS